jgi:hypothetical protein
MSPPRPSLSGRRSLSDASFCMTALTDAARRTIAEHETLVLSDRDRAIFFDERDRRADPRRRLLYPLRHGDFPRRCTGGGPQARPTSPTGERNLDRPAGRRKGQAGTASGRGPFGRRAPASLRERQHGRVFDGGPKPATLRFPLLCPCFPGFSARVGEAETAPKGRFYPLEISKRFWSGRRDSNPRPQPWQGCALPLSYARAPLIPLS